MAIPVAQFIEILFLGPIQYDTSYIMLGGVGMILVIFGIALLTAHKSPTVSPRESLVALFPMEGKKEH